MACVIPRAPSDDALFLEALAGGLDAAAALGRCDRIRDPALRGECVLSIVEVHGLHGADGCARLHAGGPWREACALGQAWLPGGPLARGFARCAEAGSLEPRCREGLLEGLVAAAARGDPDAGAFSEALEARLADPALDEAARARARALGWRAWSDRRDVLSLAPCAALHEALAAPCRQGVADAVEDLVALAFAEDPGRARWLCDHGLVLQGYRPLAGGPKLADEPALAALAREAAQPGCGG